MKMRFLPLITALFSALATYAQGTINFSNGAAGVNAPFYNLDVTRLSGTGFIAGLFAGPSGTVWSSLTLVAPTTTFATGTSAGYFFGGSHTIPGVPEGSVAAYQVRVWSSNFATWDLAWAASQVGGQGAQIAVSANAAWNGAGLPTVVGTTPPLGGLSPTPNLLGLQSAFLHGEPLVPEPSTLMVGLVGATAWLLCRRWHRSLRPRTVTKITS